MQQSPIAELRARLRLPLIAAPMFLVSGVALVSAACVHGVIGAFPTVNCRTPEELDGWLREIESRTSRSSDASGVAAAPVCPNLIVHRSNMRLQDDLAVLLRHRPELVITSVGSPAPVIAPLHDAGALVLADVASLRHAERAVEAGADGLVLLTAGAGGQTGWLNPFAFVRAVRGTLMMSNWTLRHSGCRCSACPTRILISSSVARSLPCPISMPIAHSPRSTLSDCRTGWLMPA